jgi:hypothetical protein
MPRFCLDLVTEDGQPFLVPGTGVGPQGELATLPATGRGEQRLGLRHVELAVGAGTLARAVEVRAHVAFRRAEPAEEDLVDDRLPVDRERNRLAHADIREPRVVEREADVGERVARLLEKRVLELRHGVLVLRRRHVVEDVQLAGLEVGVARGVLVVDAVDERGRLARVALHESLRTTLTSTLCFHLSSIL